MTKPSLLLLLICAFFLLDRAQSVGAPYDAEFEIEVIPLYSQPPPNNEESSVIPPYNNEESVVIPPYNNEESSVIPPYNNEESVVIPPYNNEESPVIPPYNNEEAVIIEPIVPPYNNEESVVVPPYNNEESSVVPPYSNEEDSLPPLEGAESVKVSSDKYVCPEGYTYLSFEDANNFNGETCARYKPGSTYRLLGGGSASGSNKQCQTSENDPKLYRNAVCVKTQIEQIRGVIGECPTGTARATLEEVQAHTQTFCDALGTWDIARIAFMGSMDGSGYNCGFRDYDSRELGPTLCVKRNILDIQLLDSCENVCGEGKNLLTVQEALASQGDYCSLLGPYEIVRLAGGGSMDGSGYGCKIRDTDRRHLGSALCANKRA